jgi:hypothetical protein
MQAGMYTASAGRAGAECWTRSGRFSARVLKVSRHAEVALTKGPVMMEMFEAPTMERPDPEIPYIYADACQKSIEMIEAALGEA